MKSKTFYRVCIKTALGHLYYLSDNDMSTPGVGPDGKTNIDSFDHESENFAFISNCTPSEVYHFSSKSKAEDAIKNLPFPYNEKCQLMAVTDAKYSLYKRIYYRVGKISFPGVLWCDAEGVFGNQLPKGPKTLFVDKFAAEKFLSSLDNAPIGAAVFEFYDFGAPDFLFWYKSNSGAIYTNEGKVQSQRTDIDLKKCAFGDVGVPQYVSYRFYKLTEKNCIAWMNKDNTFDLSISDDTLSIYTLNDAKKYFKDNSLEQNVKMAEVYSSGHPEWKWNYKDLSTGKVYTSSSVEIEE